MDYLRHKGIDVEVDSKTLEIDGIEIESVKGLSVSKGTIRELLMRVLDAQELTYRVLENHIQITSQNRAQEIPTICYYDLSFVQTNSNRLMEIINAIETSIEPDSWVNNGGVSSIVPLGQILVVSSTESAHQEIERLLARLSQTLAESSPKRHASNKTNENKANEDKVRSSQPASEDPFGAGPAGEDPFEGSSQAANNDPFK
jgi:DNA-binding NtrC family response regulator